MSAFRDYRNGQNPAQRDVRLLPEHGIIEVKARACPPQQYQILVDGRPARNVELRPLDSGPNRAV